MASGTRALGAICLALAALVLAPAGAAGSTIVVKVDTTADGMLVPEVSCEELAPESCPLRAALEAAQDLTTNGGAEIRVVVPAGTYLLNPAKGPLPLGNAKPSACLESGGVKKCPVTLEGAGAGRTIIDGRSETGLIATVAKGAPVTVAGVTLTNGRATSKFGGAISVNETETTVRDSLLAENLAAEGGGAIEAFGSPLLRILRSSITRNEAAFGGGIDVALTPLEVIDSTVAFNRATAKFGGGIALEEEPGVGATIINSTIAGNTAATIGGAINGETTGTVILRESTVSGNSAVKGGGIEGGKTLSIEHSILSGNIPDQCTNVAEATALEANIVFGGSSCGFSGVFPMLVDPKLGSLSANGGLGQTIPLLRGSPALNAGGAACPSATFAGLVTDERGVTRPQGSGCDLGAFESASDAGLTLSSAPNPVVPGANVAMTARAVNSGSETLTGVTVTIPIPAGAAFVSAQAGCGAAAGAVTCQLGTLAMGATGTAVVTVRPEHAGTLAESASVLADQPDYNPSNDTASFAGVVNPPPVTSSALVARILSVNAKGVVTLRLGCRGAAAAVCPDALAIYSARGGLPAAASAHRKPRATLLAHGHVSVAAGRTVTVHLKLDRAGLKLARKHRSFAARLLLSLRAAGKGVVSHTYPVTLKRAKGR